MFCSSLALFSLFLAATAAVPFHLENGMTMVNTLHRRDLIADLGPQLSSHATLYSPNSSDWATQSSRWSTYSAPTFQLVVAPAVDEDIVAVVGIIVLQAKPKPDDSLSSDMQQVITSPFSPKAADMATALRLAPSKMLS